MLRFASASNGLVETSQAAAAAVKAAAPAGDAAACKLVVFHVTMGHDHRALLATLRKACPSARIVGCTCAGIIGREGADESPRALGLMLVWGEAADLSLAYTERLDGNNARTAAATLAGDIVKKHGKPRFCMLLASGIDVDADGCIEGIESAFGKDVTVFGGTSADTMQGIASYQFLDDSIHEHAAVLVGFHDASLRVDTRASHGFVPAPVQLEVTRAEGNRIFTISGEPAWTAYARGLGLPPSATPGDTIPPGAVGVALSPAEIEEYGDSHLLRVITKKLGDGSMLMPVRCATGTKLTLMRRDEERIFRNLDVMMKQFQRDLAGRRVQAVFHADCGARGRLTLDRVSKTDIVRAMQEPLMQGNQCPPWLGMYGFGELARLLGKNTFHNYTTALYVISRG